MNQPFPKSGVEDHVVAIDAVTAEDGERYSYAVDPGGDSTANKVLRLVGKDKRVLELGPGPGSMTRFMQAQGCRVTAIEYDPELARHAEPFCERLLIGDLETLDLAESLEGARFDVVVAADVLEHLRDPWACLRKVRGLIADGGYLVVSIPNVAHNAVIAQLLCGRFPYTEQGLLDRTHLRFFSRHDVDDLLLSTGFLPSVWERNRVPVEFSEFTYAWQRLPAAVREALAHADEGETYQYIVQAYVGDTAGWAAKVRSERLAMEVDYQRLQTKLDQTRTSLEEYQKAFEEGRDLIADRDKTLSEYVQAFHKARNTLEERDKALDEVNRAFNEAREIIARIEYEKRELHQALDRNALVRLKKFVNSLLGRS